MKQAWQIKELGDVCNIGLGKTPYRANKSFWDISRQTGNVWLSIADLLTTSNNIIYDSKEYITDEAASTSKIVKEGTLLLSFKLTLGRMAFAGKDLFTNEAIASLPIKDAGLLNKYFLYYFFIYFDWDTATESEIKVKGKTLNKAKLQKIKIPIPPLSEQQKIVGALDKTFSAIEQAKQHAEQNLKNAKELFNSYLQNIDAKKVALTDLVNITTGRLNSNEAVDNGEYPFFTCSRDVFAIDKYAFDLEAILLAGNNASGDFNVKHYKGKFNAYQRTYVITVNEKSQVLYRYLYFQLLNSLKEFKNQSVGANTRFLKIGMIYNLQIPLPNIEEQNQIINTLDNLLFKTQQLEAIYQNKLNNLKEIKKSILQKAFNGNLIL